MPIKNMCGGWFNEEECVAPEYYMDFNAYLPGPIWYPKPERKVIEISEEDSTFDRDEERMQPEPEEEAAAPAKGFAPSQQDIESLRDETEDKVSFDRFQDFLVNVNHPEDTVQNLSRFFNYFDTERTGTLSKKSILNLMTNFGEPLREDCVDLILQ